MTLLLTFCCVIWGKNASSYPCTALSQRWTLLSGHLLRSLRCWSPLDGHALESKEIIFASHVDATFLIHSCERYKSPGWHRAVRPQAVVMLPVLTGTLFSFKVLSFFLVELNLTISYSRYPTLYAAYVSVRYAKNEDQTNFNIQHNPMKWCWFPLSLEFVWS